MMTYIRILFCCLFAHVMIAVPALAEDAATSHAVVNVERVMRTTKAAESIEKQLKKKSEEFSKEFSKKERELKEAQEKLIEENNNLGKDASEEAIKDFEKKRKEFEKKRFETQELFQKRRGSLTKAVNLANAQLQKEMFQTVANIAEEKQYKIVFDRKSVVIVQEDLDITDKVIKKLNSSISEIKLDVK